MSDLASLGARVENHDRDLYGVGSPTGVGLMGRVAALEQIAADERAARRWLIALMVTTLFGAAQTVLRMWIG